MKKGKLCLVLGIVVLVVALLVVACVAPAPTPTPTPTPSPTPSPTPAPPPTAEIIKIKLCSSISTGSYGIQGNFIADRLEAATDGRMQVQTIWEEEVAPIAEHMPALRDGVFDLYYTWQGYPAGLMPVLQVVGFAEMLIPNNEAWWVLHEKYGLKEILDEEYAKWNAYFVAFTSYVPGAYMICKEPVPTIDDLNGKKLRVAGDIEPKILEDLGCGSIWMPGGEVYTAMASGLVDGAIYGSFADYYAMGWHEVTKYWIMPAVNPVLGDTITANMDFWNSLSEGDQWLITTVCEASGLAHNHTVHYDSAKALKAVVEEHGIIIQTWPEESVKKWKELTLKHAPEPADAASEKAMEAVMACAEFYS